MEPRRLFGANDEGCYADRSLGNYIGVYVIDFAETQGFNINDLNEEYGQICDREQEDAPTWEEFLTGHEFYHDIWDSAENHLNGLTAPGYYFGSNEGGDWGLWELEE